MARRKWEVINTAEYIDKEVLLEAFDHADADVLEDYGDGTSRWGFGIENILKVINSIPAADVAPVLHGLCFRFDTDTEQFFLCNRCKKKEYLESNYCLNCDAKMDLEDTSDNFDADIDCIDSVKTNKIDAKCKYEGMGIWSGRCTGTKEVGPCIRYEKCELYRPIHMTNAQKIRSMSDDELNELFHDIYNAGVDDASSYEWGHRTNSFEWTMDWLQQSAKGE